MLDELSGLLETVNESCNELAEVTNALFSECSYATGVLFFSIAAGAGALLACRQMSQEENLDLDSIDNEIIKSSMCFGHLFNEVEHNSKTEPEIKKLR